MTARLTEDQYDVAPAPYDLNTPAPQYGSEVAPMGPRQDMYAVDVLAGGPVEDRTGNPAGFTGGDLEKGLGGTANPPISNGVNVDGVERGLPMGI